MAERDRVGGEIEGATGRRDDARHAGEGAVVQDEALSREINAAAALIEAADFTSVEFQCSGGRKRARAVKINRGVAEQGKRAGGLQRRQKPPAEHETRIRLQRAGVQQLDADAPAVDLDGTGGELSAEGDRAGVRRVERDGAARDHGIRTNIERRQRGGCDAAARGLSTRDAADADEGTIAAEHKSIRRAL